MKKWFENKGNQYKERETKSISQKTKSLFWLNVSSGTYRFFGGFLIICGLITLFFNLIIAIILIGLSIFLLIKGHQQRLEFKLRSGYIVYNGGR